MLVRLKKKLKKKHALLIVSVATALAGVFAISVNKICKIMEILITSNISMILYILFIKIANTPAKATATLASHILTSRLSPTVLGCLPIPKRTHGPAPICKDGLLYSLSPIWSW